MDIKESFNNIKAFFDKYQIPVILIIILIIVIIITIFYSETMRLKYKRFVSITVQIILKIAKELIFVEVITV